MKKKTLIIVAIIIAIICIAILLRYVFYSGTSRIIRYVSYEEENKTNLEKNTESENTENSTVFISSNILPNPNTENYVSTNVITYNNVSEN